ncbi:hypothetical protein LY90DRAFT_634254 [Neocallimastix californiae]|uniref:Uncharacterized protein n=1 Tax=Neocallimastix californiae TaxID=1754190 RepID=A0A1Y2FPF5_9FUNG|nr:hypothetical protein LY90DRAFT_634254 [Neocallimastix californiae]|eukprot:ORY85882.1 hypothetical protein LY90DRAFT_634254 [Neocallimastix californiae]
MHFKGGKKIGKVEKKVEKKGGKKVRKGGKKVGKIILPVVKESVEEVPIAVEEETEVKEEIVEVPSEDPDRNMFIQRIIRYIARTNLTTGEKKFTKRIIRYITRINPNTDEKEVVEELGNETPFEPDDINRMSKKELRNFIREQPLRLIESIRFEAVTRIIPLINQYEERLRTQPRSELKIMFRTIMEFLAKKIILLDRINSDDKEILSECIYIPKRNDNNKPDEELVTEVKEEVVEVPSEEPDKKKFIKKIIKCTTIINPITGRKEVVKESVEEIPIAVEEETEVKEEVVEVPSEEPVVKESVEEVPITVEEETEVKEEIAEVPSEEQEKVRTQPRSELKIMFRTIMEFLAQKIKLLDRIESKDKEIICKLKCLFTDLQLLERRIEEM